ncbi:MAG: hypothetical protein OHK93_008683 [Ramalina farinacea]|uniref:Uncharacterized protein n=1 Tax=Ramalina farinacea TaxID=258253 RepID=A0AA43TWS4_9LECA|nr:hypothetical protein [Ramalina farinacea]
MKGPYDDFGLRRWLPGDGPYDSQSKAGQMRLYDVDPNPRHIRFNNDTPLPQDLPPHGVYLSCLHVCRLLETKLSWKFLTDHWPAVFTLTKGISENYEPLGAPAICEDEQGQIRYVVMCGKQLIGWHSGELYKREKAGSQDRRLRLGDFARTGTYPYDALDREERNDRICHKPSYIRTPSEAQIFNHLTTQPRVRTLPPPKLAQGSQNPPAGGPSAVVNNPSTSTVNPPVGMLAHNPSTSTDNPPAYTPFTAGHNSPFSSTVGVTQGSPSWSFNNSQGNRHSALRQSPNSGDTSSSEAPKERPPRPDSVLSTSEHGRNIHPPIPDFLRDVSSPSPSHFGARNIHPTRPDFARDSAPSPSLSTSGYGRTDFGPVGGTVPTVPSPSLSTLHQSARSIQAPRPTSSRRAAVIQPPNPSSVITVSTGTIAAKTMTALQQQYNTDKWVYLQLKSLSEEMQREGDTYWSRLLRDLGNQLKRQTTSTLNGMEHGPLREAIEANAVINTNEFFNRYCIQPSARRHPPPPSPMALQSPRPSPRHPPVPPPPQSPMDLASPQPSPRQQSPELPRSLFGPYDGREDSPIVE